MTDKPNEGAWGHRKTRDLAGEMMDELREENARLRAEHERLRRWIRALERAIDETGRLDSNRILAAKERP